MVAKSPSEKGSPARTSGGLIQLYIVAVGITGKVGPRDQCECRRGMIRGAERANRLHPRRNSRQTRGPPRFNGRRLAESVRLPIFTRQKSLRISPWKAMTKDARAKDRKTRTVLTINLFPLRTPPRSSRQMTDPAETTVCAEPMKREQPATAFCSIHSIPFGDPIQWRLSAARPKCEPGARSAGPFRRPRNLPPSVRWDCASGLANRNCGEGSGTCHRECFH